MRSSTYCKNFGYGLWQCAGTARWASSSCRVDALRPGNLVMIKSQLHKVTNQRKITFGRASTYYQVEVHPYGDPSSESKLRCPPEESFVKVEPERMEAKFMYFDVERRLAMVSDAEFNELEVPISLLPQYSEKVLKPGDSMSLLLHEGQPLACALPQTLQNSIRQAAKSASG